MTARSAESPEQIAERFVEAFMGDNVSATVYRDRLVVMVKNAVTQERLYNQEPSTEEWEYGVEYEVDHLEENNVFTAAHSERQARKWADESPTDTGLRRRRPAGPWEVVP